MKDKKNSKQQIAYEFIRSKILEGIYSQGQRIIIDQLAKELSLSKIPIREAISRLEAEGFVTLNPYSGPTVVCIEENQYEEILSTLAVLDSYAAAISIPLYPKDQIKNLHEVNQKMKQALEDFDFFNFVSLNKEFHLLTVKYCPNKYLLNEIEKLWERLDTIRRMRPVYFSIRAKEVIGEHERIISIFENENEDNFKTQQYIQEHHLKALVEKNNQKTTFLK